MSMNQKFQKIKSIVEKELSCSYCLPALTILDCGNGARNREEWPQIELFGLR